MTKITPLPFALSSSGGFARVAQAWGGTTSHTGYLERSLDFSVPFGTPVLALGRGVVVDLVESVKDGAAASQGSSDASNGKSNIGNFVTIYYPDYDVVATTAHLQQNSIVPSVGDAVAAGQLVGLVGNTGLRDATHLHYTVGIEGIKFGAGIVANGSASLATPVLFDTATGGIEPGILTEKSFDLSTYALRGLPSNLTLVGGANISAAGDGSRNIISGNRGDNVIDGRAGNDTIYGGAGNDTIVGGAGDDTLFGGTGADTASYATASAGVTVSLLMQGRIQNTGAAGSDVLNEFENLVGSAYSDVLIGDRTANILDGNSGNDLIFGGAGNDFVRGGDGNDTIYGEDGNDLLAGGKGNDALSGGDGADTLIGGAGRDVMSGGTGRDSFVFERADDSPAGASNRDLILDFLRFEDKIDLSVIDANTTRSGNQAFTFIGGQGFHGRAGEVAFHGNLIEGDVNGDARADFQIEVRGIGILGSSDFFL